VNRLVAARSPATQWERVWSAVVWQASRQVARDTFLEYDTPSCDQADDYDLWIGDESWELDYYLHENPEQKRAAHAWFTDFVGWLPMPGDGDREAFLTADYNAETIEQITRFPRIRDRAIFVGDPDDIVPDAFGPGLPLIRDWTPAKSTTVQLPPTAPSAPRP